MTQVAEQNANAPVADTDLVAAVRRVLAASPEPLTLSKIRSALPAGFRSLTLEALAEALQRLVTANVLVQYPKYRSPQDRFWDRPMAVHVAALLRQTLEEGPLPWSELRRKLPAYAAPQAEGVLQEQVAQGLLHRHPKAGSRGGERFGVRPPEAKDYLRPELTTLFRRLGELGFSHGQLRQSALELLHEEEWAEAPAPQAGAPSSAPHAPAADPASAVEQAETHPDAPDAATQS
jgi:hypothetical protein